MKKEYLRIATLFVALGLSSSLSFTMDGESPKNTEIMIAENTHPVSTTQLQMPFQTVDQILSSLLANITDSSVRADIQKIFTLIPETGREKVAPGIVFLMKNLDRFRRFEFFRGFYLIPDTEREKFLEMAMFFFKDLEDKECAALLKSLSSIPSDERISFIEIALPYLNLRGKGCAAFLETLSIFPTNERVRFVELAPSFFKDLDDKECAALLKDLIQPPANERMNIIEIALPLFKDLNGEQRGTLLIAIPLVPMNQQACIAQIALPLLKALNRFSFKALFEALPLILPNQRLSIIETAMPLFRVLDEQMCVDLLKTLHLMPPNEWASIVKIALPLYSEMRRLDTDITKVIHLITDEISLPLFKDLEGYERTAIVKALYPINENKRSHFVDLALPVCMDLSGEQRAAVLAALSNVPAKDQTSIVKIILPLCMDLNGEQRAFLINALNLITPNEQDCFLEIALPYIKGQNREQLTGLVKVLNQIPIHERLHFIKIAPHLFKDLDAEQYDCINTILRCLVMCNEQVSSIVEIGLPLCKDLNGIGRAGVLMDLRRIPPDERVNIVEIVQPLIEDFGGEGRIELLRTLNLIPSQEREKIIAFLLNYIKNSKIQPEQKKWTCKGEGIITRLMRTDLTFRKSVINYWTQILLSPDQHKAKEISDLILKNTAQLGLNAFDPIVEEAITIQNLNDNSNDPNNPYRFFDKLKKKRADPIIINPATFPKLEGTNLSLNPYYLTSLPGLVVTFKDLPKYSKTLLTDMKSQILGRLQNTENRLYITLEEYKLLLAGSLDSYYLPNLLSVQGQASDVVYPIAGQFIAIIAYLESLDNTPSLNKFSEREDQFVLMLQIIQECSTGKEGGVEEYYARLPKSGQFEIKYSSKGIGFLESIIRTKLKDMFSGTNAFFLELTKGTADKEINQAIHQAKYVKNLIGHEVGLYPKNDPHALGFDRHTQVININLLDREKQNVVDLFYMHFLPEILVDAIFVAINDELKHPKSTLFMDLCKDFGQESWFKDAWEFDTKIGMTSIKRSAIIDMMMRIGAFQEVK